MYIPLLQDKRYTLAARMMKCEPNMLPVHLIDKLHQMDELLVSVGRRMESPEMVALLVREYLTEHPQ